MRIWDIKNSASFMIPGVDSWAGAVAWNPDGRELATSGYHDHSVRLWAVEDQFAERILTRGAKSRSVAWSPNGRWIASTHHDLSVRVWEANTGTCKAIFRGHTGQETTDITWSPDSRKLASGGGADKTVRIWNLEPGTSGPVLSHKGNVHSVAWRRDGKYLASGTHSEGVRLWDPATGRALKSFPGIRFANGSHLNWNPVNGRLAAGGAIGNNGRLAIFNPADGRIVDQFDEESRIWSAAWSPDGKWLACGTYGGKISIFDSQALAASEPAFIWRVGHYASCLSWSSDGQWLASPGGGELGGLVRLWNVSTKSPGPDLHGHLGKVWGVSFSPDGRYLASSGDDAVVRIWDTATMQLIRITIALPGEESATFTLAGQLITDLEEAGQGLVYIVQREAGELELLSPAGFADRVETAAKSASP